MWMALPNKDVRIAFPTATTLFYMRQATGERSCFQMRSESTQIWKLVVQRSGKHPGMGSPGGREQQKNS